MHHSAPLPPATRVVAIAFLVGLSACHHKLTGDDEGASASPPTDEEAGDVGAPLERVKDEPRDAYEVSCADESCTDVFSNLTSDMAEASKKSGVGNGKRCGDGRCHASESCSSCESDCGACPVEPPPEEEPPPPPEPFCGDGSCDVSEDCAVCESDCGACPVEPPPEEEPPPPPEPVCGDAVCDGQLGEMCTTCESDCKTLDPVCGNGACESGEDSATCYGDCGPDVWPSEWATWEQEVVTLINENRAAGTDCPSGAKSPVGPLTSEGALANAARLHSWDQSYSGYFAHASCNGRSPWTRANEQGTSADGETIGWGYSSPAAMVNGWLTSTTGHCDILMSGNNSVIGVGYASPGSRLWTAMFR